MARISVEKAVEIIGNRFDLVLIASQRARELSRGSSTNLEKKSFSNSVNALREIEQGLYTKQDYLKKLSKKDHK